MIWGGLHGTFVVGEQLAGRSVDRAGAPSRRTGPRRWLAAALTFALVCLAWVFFRAQHVGDAWQIVTRIARLAPASGQPAGALDRKVGFLALAPVVMALEAVARRGGLVARIERLPALSRYALYAALIYSTILLRGVNAQFIYFQF